VARSVVRADGATLPIKGGAAEIDYMISSMEHVASFVLASSSKYNILWLRGINYLGHNSLVSQKDKLIQIRRLYNRSLVEGLFDYNYFYVTINSDFRGLIMLVSQVYSLTYIYTVNGSLLPDRTTLSSLYNEYLACNDVKDMSNLIKTSYERVTSVPSHYDRYSSHNAYLQTAIFGGLYPKVPRLLFVLPNLNHIDLLRLRCWLSLILFSTLAEKDFVSNYSSRVHESTIDHWQNPVISDFRFVMVYDDLCAGRIFTFLLNIKADPDKFNQVRHSRHSRPP